MFFSIDLEVTNRCNASCHFCPRDRTPHQGLMSLETFEQSLIRAQEYRDQVTAAVAPEPVEVEISLCGLGEPLLNKLTPEFARRVRDAGFSCAVSSNGALLDERRGREIIDAGVRVIYLNIGDIGQAYEDVYKLPFEKTRDNIVRFNELSQGQVEVCIVLVDYKADAAHLKEMRDYWGQYGISTFQEFEIMNRGGSLFVDHMQYETFPEQVEAEQMLRAGGETPLCGAPFAYLFVGYDANYYLCCSDWEKRAPLGSVFDGSFLDVTAAKLAHTIDRQAVCRTCNLDPINKLTETLQGVSAGQIDRSVADEAAESYRTVSRAIADALEQMQPGVRAAIDRPVPSRRLIPVVEAR
jgi:MoaA/NifB/PqqE/SkfB family radical SAM enzyme